MITFDQLVDNAEILSGESYEKCVLVFIECIELINDFLPPIGLNALLTAKKYWIHKEITVNQVEKARIECWNFLDEKNSLENEVYALRAIICLLYPKPPSDDIGEIIEFFMEMISSLVTLESIADKLKDL